MRDGWGLRIAAGLLVASVHGAPVTAQPRPLPLEPVEGVGAGLVTVETSVGYTHGMQFTLSGLGGDLWRLGLIRLHVGLSSIADFELSGGLRDHLTITSTTPAALSEQVHLSNPTSTGAFDDLVVGTKVRVREEQASGPGVAFDLSTRLPNAKHGSGLGQDSTDFHARLLVAKPTPVFHATVNVGLGILGDPLQGNRHVQSLLYGAELARPLTHQSMIVVGVDGRSGSSLPGLEPCAIGRGGVVWTGGAARLEVDGTVGLTIRDGNLGIAMKVIVGFHAFTP
jgi:hypothetical protein